MTALFYVLMSAGVLLAVAAIINGSTLCAHQHVSLPRSFTLYINGVRYYSFPMQTCLDCGRKRAYDIGTEPGEIQVGPWFAERTFGGAR